MKEVIDGFLFGIGFTITMSVYMFIDKFTADLNWRFWEWKRKNFKD